MTASPPKRVEVGSACFDVMSTADRDGRDQGESENSLEIWIRQMKRMRPWPESFTPFRGRNGLWSRVCGFDKLSQIRPNLWP